MLVRWTVPIGLLLLATASGDARHAEWAAPMVERFLATDHPKLTHYVAVRRLHAVNKRFKKEGRLEALTELTPDGVFRFEVLSEEGSGYIRSRVLRKLLEGEAEMWRRGDPARSGLTAANYAFFAGALTDADDRTGLRAPSFASPEEEGEEEVAAASDSGEPRLTLASIGGSKAGPQDDEVMIVLKPRRKDALLVDGAMFLAPSDGDLRRVEGRLSKNPSFWTSRVDLVRRYARVQGVRVPVETTSVAHVKIVGESRLEMSYDYRSVNGESVK